MTKPETKQRTKLYGALRNKKSQLQQRLERKQAREKDRKSKWKQALMMQYGLIPKIHRKVKRRNGVLYWTY